MKVFIASDHAGVELKAHLQKNLKAVGSDVITWVDLGPSKTDSVDYPDFAQKLATEMQAALLVRSSTGETVTPKNEILGILTCGSGIGMSIAANRFPWIRAALVTSETMACLSREHNAANVLVLGARLASTEELKRFAEIFLKTPAATEERHLRRVRKLN